MEGHLAHRSLHLLSAKVTFQGQVEEENQVELPDPGSPGKRPLDRGGVVWHHEVIWPVKILLQQQLMQIRKTTVNNCVIVYVLTVYL